MKKIIKNFTIIHFSFRKSSQNSSKIRIKMIFEVIICSKNFEKIKKMAKFLLLIIKIFVNFRPFVSQDSMGLKENIVLN
jgi:hypothetical protein